MLLQRNSRSSPGLCAHKIHSIFETRMYLNIIETNIWGYLGFCTFLWIQSYWNSGILSSVLWLKQTPLKCHSLKRKPNNIVTHKSLRAFVCMVPYKSWEELRFLCRLLHQSDEIFRTSIGLCWLLFWLIFFFAISAQSLVSWVQSH